ncbi:hypothetical protein IQ252_23675, partial [Tychonema sp. LEGE 07203]|nr:hypothetical protein [Tychonema sp. LEGE 07203]
MNDEQEKNQILTQQPETVSTASDEFPNAEMVSANSTAEPTETPAEIVANEDIATTINEPETIPIPAEYAPETSQLVSDSYPTTYTAISEPKPAQKWQILAVFLSGMLVGSV